MYTVRNIAPFINDGFTITSKWWDERINPVTGETEIHRGLDISTGVSKPVYSILDGEVHSKGTSDSRGNWIIIKDNRSSSSTYGYATLYMHLANLPSLRVGDVVEKGSFIAYEGTTGQSTGIHLHVEMQDLNRWNNEWHTSYVKSDYLDPTIYMGIDNIEGTEWIYEDTPRPTPPSPSYKRKKNKFKFVLFKNNKKLITRS